MKRIIMIAFVFAATLAVPGFATAQTETTEPTAAQQETRARVEKYKASVTGRLSDAAESNIKRKCLGAQKILTRSKARFTQAVENRETRYNKLHQKLVGISQRLQQSSVDTTSLEEVVAQYKVNLDKAVASAVEYNQVITDLAEMDCNEDPAGFKAALEVARHNRKNLIEEFKSLKDFLKVNVKTELQALRVLVAKNDTSQEGESQ